MDHHGQLAPREHALQAFLAGDRGGAFRFLPSFLFLYPSHSIPIPPSFFFSFVISQRKSHSPKPPDRRLLLRPRVAPPPAPVPAGGQRKADEGRRPLGCWAEEFAGAVDLNELCCVKICQIILVEYESRGRTCISFSCTHCHEEFVSVNADSRIYVWRSLRKIEFDARVLPTSHGYLEIQPDRKKKKKRKKKEKREKDRNCDCLSEFTIMKTRTLKLQNCPAHRINQLSDVVHGASQFYITGVIGSSFKTANRPVQFGKSSISVCVVVL